MSIYEMVNIYYYYLSSEITKSLPGDNQHRLKGRENPVGAEGYFRQGGAVNRVGSTVQRDGMNDGVRRGRLVMRSLCRRRGFNF